MRIMRTVGRALAWFNLIFFGLNVIGTLFQGLASGSMALLVIAVLFAAVPLNAYAGLQLHRSIRNPEIKLNHQTPVGIRFVGAFVILMGVIFAGVGLIIVVGAKDFLPIYKENAADMPQMLTITSVGQLQGMGAEVLFLGLVILACALINMRLLRWYYLVKRSDVDVS